jgi:hypothetical protein
MAAGVLASDASARPDVLWAGPINGLWSDAANWNPMVVPGDADSAILGFATPYTVTLGSLQSVGNLYITNSAATVNLPGPTSSGTPNTLQVHAGLIQNDGLIRIMHGTGAARAQLLFMSEAVISGGGEIRLEEAVHARLDAANYLVTQHANHKVTGTGVITAASGRFISYGQVEANAPGKALAVEKTTNHGLMRAINNGTLSLSDVVQAPGGIIGAESGTITILGAVTGGIVEAGLGGVVTIPNMNASVQNVTAAGEWRIQGGFGTTAQMTVLPGTLTNDGTIRVMSSGGTTLRFEPGTTLQGTGNVSLEQATKAWLTFGPSLIHGAGHFINGTGSITSYASGTLTNHGTIWADAANSTLSITSSMINAGVLRARNGATLRVNHVTQDAAGLVLIDGGLLAIDGVINGGTIRAVNVPMRFTAANASVNGVHAQGEWILVGGSGNPALNVGTDGLVNDGLIRAPGTIALGPNAVLSGPGQIVLEIGTISGSAAGKAVNAQGHTIRGSGAVQNLINRGEIRATQVSSPLSFTGVHNESKITAINNAVIVLNGVTQTEDGVIELQSGLLRVHAMNVEGGRLRCLPGAVAQGSNAYAPGRLDGVAFEGEMFLLPPTQATASHFLQLGSGGIENNGRIRIDSDASKGTNGIVLADSAASVEIGGVGEIVLAGDKAKSIIVARSGKKLTIGSDQTISGVGSIYAEAGGTLVNKGSIRLNVPGQSMILREIENEGLIHVDGGGFEARVIRQSSSGRIHYTSGSTNFGGISITGGSITGDSTMQVRTSKYAALTNHADWLVTGFSNSQNAVIDLGAGTFENHGTIRFVPANYSSAFSALEVIGNVSLAGTGEIVFESFDRSGIGIPVGLTLANQEGHTIRGVAEFQGSGFLVNHGMLKPGLPYGMIAAKAKITLAPTSLLEMEFAGPDAAQQDQFKAIGAMTLGGTLRVVFNNGYQLPPCGEQAFITGPCTGTFANLELPTMPAGKLRVRYDTGAVVLTYQPADHDGSGFVDTDDFSAFITDFEAGADAADFDNSGFVDTDDFTAFIYAFEAGC